MTNLALVFPEIFLSLSIMFLLILGVFKKNSSKLIQNISLIILLITSVITLNETLGIQETLLFNSSVVIDYLSSFMKIVTLLAAFLVLVISSNYLKTLKIFKIEYPILILSSVLGMMIMISSNDLIVFYMGLELQSLALYVLATFNRDQLKSSEAGLKYFVLSALSSGLLLYGCSLIYGFTGSTNFNIIANQLNSNEYAITFGIVFILVGLAFKISAVPFHMWAPDVYEGAPIPITAWLSVCSKIAIVAFAIRFFTTGIFPVVNDWQPILMVLAVLTMVGGNLLALVQKNMKRLLAYSSIGHAGYLLMGLAALVAVTDEGMFNTDFSHLVSNGLIFHMIAYGVTNFAIFYCLILVYNSTGRDDIQGLAGLSSRQPMVALVMVCSLFSLAGLPVFAGFTSKFYLFNAVASQGYLLMVGVAIVASLISLYYYLTVARYLYIEKVLDESIISVSVGSKCILGVLLIFMVVGGIFPSPLMDLIQTATDSVLKVE